MDLVLSGRVTESALLTLSCDILSERGVLPVGEIGKSLQVRPIYEPFPNAYVNPSAN